MSKLVLLKSHTSRLFAALILVLLIWQVPALYQSAQGNIQYYVVDEALQKWQKGEVPTEEAYQQILNAANRALESQPESAHYILTLAKVLEWGMHFHFETSGAEILIPLYKKAISLRPEWPVAYADYGFVLAFWGNDLPGAVNQLQQAEYYGPFLPEVLRQQLGVGLAKWDALSPTDKAWLLKISGRAAEGHWSSLATLRDLVAKYQREIVVCAYLFNRTPPLADEKVNYLGRLCAHQAAS
ncbi:hypothetical protein KJY73_13345 [Bowmanella sp. Y26]|uniref:hypothetical protein n=1 Tax=Bowmanella yangjiangensis TaxID=2811230 RepID=UPI001BDDA243|nr:hypothetical protein [Bowmanella yangjiangensis]MBT1064569.1 hypothetical protein [Bowmanella yangjiangensis]